MIHFSVLFYSLFSALMSQINHVIVPRSCDIECQARAKQVRATKCVSLATTLHSTHYTVHSAHETKNMQQTGTELCIGLDAA